MTHKSRNPVSPAPPPGWKAEWDRCLRQIATLKAEKRRLDEALAWIEQRCEAATYRTAGGQVIQAKGPNLVAMALAETTP